MQVARLPRRAPGVFEMSKQRARVCGVCIHITFVYVVCGDKRIPGIRSWNVERWYE